VVGGGWKSSNFSQLPVEGELFSLTFPFIEVIRIQKRFIPLDVTEQPTERRLSSSTCSSRRSLPLSYSRSKAMNEGSPRWNSKFVNCGRPCLSRPTTFRHPVSLAQLGTVHRFAWRDPERRRMRFRFVRLGGSGHARFRPQRGSRHTSVRKSSLAMRTALGTG
jgi:hypothetical protein